VPDVAALAGGPGYAVYGIAGDFQGLGWTSVYGTSASAPLWAALVALTDEGAPGHRLGLLNPSLYRVASTTPSAFTDITVGQNDAHEAGSPPNNNDTCTYNGMGDQPCYEATPGYDMVTGLGTPVGAVLASAINGRYTMVAADGGIFAFGSAGFFGSMGGRPLNKPIVGISTAPGAQGYWEVASDGGIFAFGDAGFFGSMGGRPLNQPIVGLAATGNGQGYWEVASDGGIFAFGDAAFFGSMGGRPLNQPIVGLQS
jgi:hypothetical protein